MSQDRELHRDIVSLRDRLAEIDAAARTAAGLK
jgi:hypothetical protein